MSKSLPCNPDSIYEALYNLLLKVELIVTPYQRRKESEEVMTAPRY